ncbi:astacin [Oesophagostomum dentatum]|uniref:Zinc metalloproteinase n=1 Tax=Oesophagostomum dentatum TaxID=61180 RepID=A0A0B1TH62_OESDE|nr:astacin [Oesophagostomum dentatum]
MNKDVLKIREKFHKLRNKIEKELELNNEQKILLGELLKHVRNVTVTQVSSKGDSVTDINEKSNGIAEILYQGDIVLTEQQAKEIEDDIQNGVSKRSKRQAYKDYYYPRTIWDKGLYYFFHDSASEKARRAFILGAQMWQKDTCINFYQSSTASHRVRVIGADGCWSYVGRLLTTRQQDLSLGSGCEVSGIAAHEIGHALGFYHTHSRHDRDQFITVNMRNIVYDWRDQFNLESTSTNDNYGIAYDYGSIMHYGAHSASAKGGLTMVPHDPTFTETLGSYFISFYELLMMNKHYKCTAICDSQQSAQCQNGGFPHPRNCMKCICPSGYGGDLCNKRPSGCGEELQAENEPKTFRNIIGDTSRGQVRRESYDMCTYWIKAPKGSRIEVKIVSLSQGANTDGCTYWGVEIKTQEDQKHTGYRFCSPQDKGVTLVSYGNLVPIIFYNGFYQTVVQLQYRIGTRTLGHLICANSLYFKLPVLGLVDLSSQVRKVEMSSQDSRANQLAQADQSRQQALPALMTEDASTSDAPASAVIDHSRHT